MTQNQKRYMEEINYSIDYRISVKDFKQWLRWNKHEETFRKMLENKDLDLYDIALDFSIPVIMVKFFQKSIDK